MRGVAKVKKSMRKYNKIGFEHLNPWVVNDFPSTVLTLSITSRRMQQIKTKGLSDLVNLV